MFRAERRPREASKVHAHATNRRPAPPSVKTSARPSGATRRSRHHPCACAGRRLHSGPCLADIARKRWCSLTFTRALLGEIHLAAETRHKLCLSGGSDLLAGPNTTIYKRARAHCPPPAGWTGDCPMGKAHGRATRSRARRTRGVRRRARARLGILVEHMTFEQRGVPEGPSRFNMHTHTTHRLPAPPPRHVGGPVEAGSGREIK